MIRLAAPSQHPVMYREQLGTPDDKHGIDIYGDPHALDRPRAAAQHVACYTEPVIIGTLCVVTHTT